jgi:hypothetical protein
MSEPQAPDLARYGVRIRIYRLGIGDCFLLSFAEAESERHLLIDCGTLPDAPNAAKRLSRVAEHVRETTGGHLDLLVASHDRCDHALGFKLAQGVFDAMAVDRIWLGWTHDPDDRSAAALRNQARLRVEAIRLALAELAQSEEEGDAWGSPVSALMGLLHPAAGSLAATPREEAGDDALQAILARDNGPVPTFCKPGDVLSPWQGSAVRAYVLGPLQPARFGGSAPVAHSDSPPAATETLYLAALRQLQATPANPITADDRSFPFHPSLRWTDERQIEENAQLRVLHKCYHDEANAWRRIDAEWLATSARLALQLEAAGDAKSLVLAIALPDERVLLFASAARSASIDSWLAQRFTKNGSSIEGRELLRRTVFYKVGHHGSETDRFPADRLAAFQDRRLVVAIPVDEDFAHAERKWRMPTPSVVEQLTRIARGRVLRTDAAWQGPDPEPPAVARPNEWERFRKAVHLDPGGLFIDYYL